MRVSGGIHRVRGGAAVRGAAGDIPGHAAQRRERVGQPRCVRPGTREGVSRKQLLCSRVRLCRDASFLTHYVAKGAKARKDLRKQYEVGQKCNLHYI